MSLEAARTRLETERLLLRPLAFDDAPDMYPVYADTIAMQYWSDAPAASVEEAAQRVHADLDLVAGGTACFWAIVVTGTGRVGGKFALMNYSAQNRRAEVGFLLNRDYWRQGLMAEAATAVIDFAFGPLGLHRLEADTDPDNAASLSLMARLGFEREGLFPQRWWVRGEWHDSVMLGLLAPDWKRRRAA